ncbi:hypothetical protein SAMN05216374_4621 [Tardiphaga sp. OK246]|jgi:hypothetical protein|uniref:hypothetical protein n=1 Tax=Tardiphaga sp. OK246 TaxID=1855307 RepID=UPI000B74D64D|nr:hypothetical protein [Tardiphaga sp. OK246]SNT53107.1 hypothetical protein SAMN05216374_4621 [Tardiphaga sp. OK246]
MRHTKGVFYVFFSLLAVPTGGFAAEGDVQCVVKGRVGSTIDDCLAMMKSIKVKEVPRVDAAKKLQASRAQIAAGDQSIAASPVTSNTEATVFLRRNLKDLGSFAKPSKVSEAEGAQFSWTRNGISGNDTWATEGILAARLSYWEAPAYEPYLSHALFGGYFQWDRSINTRLRANDVNDATFGGSTEIALANYLQATHYVRGSVEALTDFDGRSKSWNVRVEYQPYGNPRMEGPNSLFAYLSTPLPLSSYFFLTVSPKLRAEYKSNLSGSPDPIFMNRNEAMRVGASVSAYIDGNAVGFSDVPWYVQAMHFSVSYGWWHDAYSQRNYSIFDTSLGFNLDKSGLTAIAISYRKGQLDTTAANVDLTMVTLSTKFDAALSMMRQ